MKSSLVAILIGGLAATSASAQIRPQAGSGDMRIQTIAYQEHQVFLLEASPGYHLMVELASDEQIQSVAIGDSGAWQVTANRAGNLLFIKPLEAGVETNLTVITTVRQYVFDLFSRDMADTAYSVRFEYPAEEASQVSWVAPSTGTARYRISGSRTLRPGLISDDGVQTFISWAPDAPLPATYLIDDAGRESLANGNMRDGLYIVDGVSQRLVFRLDRLVARARRLPESGETR